MADPDCIADSGTVKFHLHALLITSVIINCAGIGVATLSVVAVVPFWPQPSWSGGLDADSMVTGFARVYTIYRALFLAESALLATLMTCAINLDAVTQVRAADRETCGLTG